MYRSSRQILTAVRNTGTAETVVSSRYSFFVFFWFNDFVNSGGGRVIWE